MVSRKCCKQSNRIQSFQQPFEEIHTLLLLTENNHDTKSGGDHIHGELGDGLNTKNQKQYYEIDSIQHRQPSQLGKSLESRKLGKEVLHSSYTQLNRRYDETEILDVVAAVDFYIEELREGGYRLVHQPLDKGDTANGR